MGGVVDGLAVLSTQGCVSYMYLSRVKKQFWYLKVFSLIVEAFVVPFS